jgi:peptidyl-prolyl cis-trans isomerase C
MAAHQIDPASLWQALARELRVEAVLDLVSSRVKVPDSTDVQLFYYMHPEQFEQPETRRAHHILITLNDAYPENTREAAAQRLQLIRKRLLHKPQRFAEQAMKHSECPSALQGGLLGQVPRGTLYPELDAALFAMTAGALSELVESPVGLHLLWCESIVPARTVPLAEVMPALREKMLEKQRQRQQKAWLRELLQGRS